MGCDEWMADLLREMGPFVQEAQLAQVHATAAAMGIYRPVSPPQHDLRRDSVAAMRRPMLRLV